MSDTSTAPATSPTETPATHSPNNQDNVVPLGKKQQKLNAIEEKRLRIRAERRQRLLNQGVPEDKVDARMAQQDYDELPLDRKFERFSNFMVQTVQKLAQEINNLKHNDGVLADAMDVNFKGFAKMLLKAGVSLEDQQKLLFEAQQELLEERQAQQAAAERARAAAAKQQADLSEKDQLVALSASEKRATLASDADANGAPVPEDATVFGG